MGPQSHTKFERNTPSGLRDMEDGCARAHVQIHPTSDLCTSNSQLVSKHTPNLNAIGPAVVELPMERVSPTGSGQNIEKQNIESQNIERKISKAKYRNRKISKQQNIEVAKYRIAKYRIRKISKSQNIVSQNIEWQNI